MLKNLKLLLKSLRPSDGYQLDQSGKHIIFRTINGRVIPMRVTSEESLENLASQGVNIDPADQEALRREEFRLEKIEQLAQDYGPEVAAKWDADYLESIGNPQYDFDALRQNIINQQAALAGVDPQEFAKQQQELYDKHSSQIVNRSDLPDLGWKSSFASYANDLLAANGITKENDEQRWYMIQTLGLLMNQSIEYAKAGMSPGSMSLQGIFDIAKDDKFASVLADSKEVLADYIDPRATWEVPAHVSTALRNIEANLAAGKSGADVLSKSFQFQYSRMFSDFAKAEAKAKSRQADLPLKVEEGEIPEDLPETFANNELAHLAAYFKQASSGRGQSRVAKAASQVAIHTMARLFNSLPESSMREAIYQLQDADRGINAFHSRNYFETLKNRQLGDTSDNMGDYVEAILKTASKALQKGDPSSTIGAIKNIAKLLGGSDAAYIGAAKGLDQQKHDNKEAKKKFFGDLMTDTGRPDQNSVSLADMIIGPDGNEDYLISNQELGMLHSPGSNVSRELQLPGEKPTVASTQTEGQTAEVSPPTPKEKKPKKTKQTPEQTPLFTEEPEDDPNSLGNVLAGLEKIGDVRTIKTEDGVSKEVQEVNPTEAFWKHWNADKNAVKRQGYEVTYDKDADTYHAFKIQSSTTHGFSQSGGTFSSSEGFVQPGKGKWTVHRHDGTLVGEIPVKAAKRRQDANAMKNNILKKASEMLTAPSEEIEEPKEASSFQYEKVMKEDQPALSELDKMISTGGWSAKPFGSIQGMYVVETNTGESFTVMQTGSGRLVAKTPGDDFSPVTLSEMLEGFKGGGDPASYEENVAELRGEEPEAEEPPVEESAEPEKAVAPTPTPTKPAPAPTKTKPTTVNAPLITKKLVKPLSDEGKSALQQLSNIAAKHGMTVHNESGDGFQLRYTDERIQNDADDPRSGNKTMDFTVSKNGKLHFLPSGDAGKEFKKRFGEVAPPFSSEIMSKYFGLPEEESTTDVSPDAQEEKTVKPRKTTTSSKKEPAAPQQVLGLKRRNKKGEPQTTFDDWYRAYIKHSTGMEATNEEIAELSDVSSTGSMSKIQGTALARYFLFLDGNDNPTAKDLARIKKERALKSVDEEHDKVINTIPGFIVQNNNI